MTEEKKKLPEEAEQDHEGGHIVKKAELILSDNPTGPTIEELERYIKAHPESANKVNKSLLEAIAPALETISKITEAGEAVQSVIHSIHRIQEAVSETMTAAMEVLLNLPVWCDPDEIEKIYKELEDLEPFLNAEIKKRPEYKSMTYTELFDQLTVKDVFFFFDPDLTQGVEPPEEDPETQKLITDLLTIRDAAREAARTADKKKLLPQVYGEKPKTILVPNSAFANALRGIDGKGELIGAGPVDIAVMNQGKPNEITIYAEAWMDEGYTLTTNKPYTGYDEAVLAVVASYYVDSINKNTACIVTDADIYRTLNDMKTGVSISANQRAEVAASMKKVNNIWGRLNATDQLKKYKVTDQDGNPVEGLAIEGRLLEFRIIKVVVKGKIQQAYLIKDEPITYTHSKLTKQVITFPRSLLDVKETRRVNGKVELLDVSLSNTRARTAAKMYILKRIGVMKNDEARAIDARRKEVNKCVRENKAGTPSKPRPIAAHRKQSRVILFDTLFNAAEITSPSRKTDMKKYVFSMLDFLEGKEVITSWKARKGRGKTADAVEITV